MKKESALFLFLSETLDMYGHKNSLFATLWCHYLKADFLLLSQKSQKLHKSVSGTSFLEFLDGSMKKKKKKNSWRNFSILAGI